MTLEGWNESTIRGYKFTYDGLSRLMNATYGRTAGITTNTNRFSENVTAYDQQQHQDLATLRSDRRFRLRTD